MEQILRDHGLVVVVREGSDPYQDIYSSDMISKYSHNIHIVTDWLGDDFSSTKIRLVSVLLADLVVSISTAINSEPSIAALFIHDEVLANYLKFSSRMFIRKFSLHIFFSL